MLDTSLIGLGIDDLAKFRVVQHVCAHPEFLGSAKSYADCLGFRSIDRTASILRELADHGILERIPSDSGEPCYRLNPRPDQRRQLEALGLTGSPNVHDAGLIRQLAKWSLQRARGKRRTGLLDAPDKEVLSYGPHD